MIGAGDTVAVTGEEGTWVVDMAGTASPIVRIIQNCNAATWRMIDREKLILIPKAYNDDELPRLIPPRGILD